jgi:hypothetical protein
VKRYFCRVGTAHEPNLDRAITSTNDRLSLIDSRFGMIRSVVGFDRFGMVPSIDRLFEMIRSIWHGSLDRLQSLNYYFGRIAVVGVVRSLVR